MQDSIDRVHLWYLGRHNFLHTLLGNNPQLWAKYPRLSRGLEPTEYNAQIKKMEEETKKIKV